MTKREMINRRLAKAVVELRDALALCDDEGTEHLAESIKEAIDLLPFTAAPVQLEVTPNPPSVFDRPNV